MNQTPLEQDPAVYLHEPATLTPAERALAEQIDPLQPRHVAAVAVRVHQQADREARRDGWERFFKRAGAGLAGLALANIGVVIAWWLKAHDAAIEAAAEARAAAAAEIEYRRGVEEQMKRMEQDIRELRRELRRFVDKDPHPGFGVVAVGAP